MERIVLEVDGNTAKKWNQASAVKRSKILAFFNNVLDLIDEPTTKADPQKGYGLPDETTIQQIEARAKANHDTYETSLDNLGKTAKDQGLTEEILNRLLSEQA